MLSKQSNKQKETKAVKINDKNFIAYFLFVHFGLSLCLSFGLAAASFSNEQIISFHVGQLLAALLVSSLSLALRMMLFEKSFALPIGVIVFKYAFLGIISYMLASSGAFDMGLCGLGLFVIVPSSVATGFLYTQKQKKLEIEG